MSIPENKTRIRVRVYPNADRNEIVSLISGVLRIRISAAPMKGKANKELVSFLGRLLDTSKDNISIAKGHTDRNKLVVIDGFSQNSILKLLLLGKDK